MDSPDRPFNIEPTLAANEQRFRALASATSDVIYSVSPDWQVMYELDGRGFLKDAHSPIKGWKEINVYAGDMDLVNSHIAAAISKKEIFALEHRVNMANGSIGWTFSRAVPILNDEGEITEWFGTASDITARKEAEIALLEAEENLRMAMESGGIATWRLDEKTGTLTTSARFNEIYGYEGKELSYAAAFSQINKDQQLMVQQSVDASLGTGEPFDVNYQLQPLNDKNYRWVRSIGKRVIDSDNGNYITGVLVDITQQKNEEIRRSDFIGMVSHELKTPLTSIKGNIQLVLRSLAKNGDIALIDKMQRADLQVQRMTKMIDSYLNLSKLESAKVAVNYEIFSLKELIIETVQESNGTQLACVKAVELDECIINADKEKISQVLQNLVANALKYSKNEAIIEITCKKKLDNVIITVSDNGIGISAADLPNIFDRFFRAEEAKMSTTSGFGIGLYLCKEIISMHNGKIWAESKLGNGSIFSFTIPTKLNNSEHPNT